VEFIDNLYIYSVYPILYQQTILSVPQGNKIEYYTKTEANLNIKTGGIQYGPLYGPYKEEELRVHFELSVPLIYFPTVEKHFELSHLGSIAIVEQYALKNDAAKLKGEFNRLRYTGLTNQNQGNYIFRRLHAQLPRKAHELYYRDAVGNVSTSGATRESSYVFFEIKPRFPVLGGWQTKWEQGYKLLNKFYIKYDTTDPDLYIFNNTFGYAFKNIRADNYKVRIMLPPTAHDIKVILFHTIGLPTF
jgi:oligosaccharyltransferase complex subunit alpha (ribophorin I)